MGDFNAQDAWSEPEPQIDHELWDSVDQDGVPTDWYRDPAEAPAPEKTAEGAAEEENRLIDAADAFLTAHEKAGSTGPSALISAPERPEKPGKAPGPVPLGLVPALNPGDEGELSWQVDALCAQTDPEAFFPEKGGSTRDAKRVCGSCEVRAQCLEYALKNDERFGIWGGLSERERRRLRKRAI